MNLHVTERLGKELLLTIKFNLSFLCQENRSNIKLMELTTYSAPCTVYESPNLFGKQMSILCSFGFYILRLKSPRSIEKRRIKI